MTACETSDSLRIQDGLEACPKCGSTPRVGRGFCLNCMLSRALGCETETTETLDEVLDETDVRDADWRIGNYQILEEIGRGGMGVIYRARQRHSRRIVALKRILSYQAESQETLVRFRREAEAAASLDHPNILPIYEVSESDDGLPFFSMKFAAGGSLLDSARSLRNDPRRIIGLIAKVTRAVQFAHLQGILHRDLKPGNILLDGRGEPLVSDFGLAKWLDTSSDLTRTLMIFGTPGYIAPEQAHGAAKNLTPAADIYSIGAVLFDLFTGRTPFLGEHALAVIKQAVDKPAPKLRTLAPLADRDVETICAKCLEREPQARYRSAGDLAEDLERWLQGRPIIARPVSPPVRIWRWSKRNPKLAASIAACLLAISAAAIRQVQTSQLAATVREKQLAAHSTTVLPFLDLDNASADVATSNAVTAALQAEISQFGPAKVVAQTELFPRWTGAGIADEVESAARHTGSRTVLAGTVRRIEQGQRVSLRLIKENGTDVLGKWTLDLNQKLPLHQALLRNKIAESIYAAFDERSGVIDSLQNDPTMLDETSRGYFNAGRALLDRRTIADMDRAIGCFKAAIGAAPRSVAARSYLAMAYMGRNYLLADPATIERAYETAQEAISLAPQNPTANRGLCYVAEARGRYTEALEYGLRTIELGDQSERAFGEIAYAWRMLGRPDKAVLWYNKAKASNRQPADYDALLGDCYLDLGLDVEARKAYETAANFRPDLPEGWMGLVYLKLINADLSGARDLFAARSQEYAAFPAATQLSALVTFFSRDYPDAEGQYERLSRDNPGGSSQHYGAISYASALARIKQEENRANEVAELINGCIIFDLKQLGQLQPTDRAEILYRLAADYAITRDVSTSLNYLRDSIAIGWLDYRSPRVDPRFDAIAKDPQFKKILDDLATRVADLRRQGLTDKGASTKK